MGSTDIIKTYKPPVVNDIMTVITYDIPIHWVVILENGIKVQIYKAGQDASKDLKNSKSWVTIAISRENYSVVMNDGAPIDEDNGFSLDLFRTTYDSITVKITIDNHDIESPDAPHDRILIVQEKRFYVDSSYLSLWSKYFERLFHGDLAEKDLIEIKIEEVDPDEFDELFKVMSPSRKEITGTNVVFLWKLADRFNIPIIDAMCEQFLTTSPGAYSLPLWDKLNVAIAMKSEKLENQSRAIMEKIPIGK